MISKTLLFALTLSLLIINSRFCHARLGESPNETKARYGSPVNESGIIMLPLFEGTFEQRYLHNGWRIRVAYLENQSIMIAYMKVVRQGTQEARLRDDEIQAILNAEAGGHYWKEMKRGAELTKSKKFQGMFNSSIKLWIHPNGSIACVPVNNVLCLISREGLTFEIQQAEMQETNRKNNIKSF
jgi:hypothetical protein